MWGYRQALSPNTCTGTNTCGSLCVLSQTRSCSRVPASNYHCQPDSAPSLPPHTQIHNQTPNLSRADRTSVSSSAKPGSCVLSFSLVLMPLFTSVRTCTAPTQQHQQQCKRLSSTPAMTLQQVIKIVLACVVLPAGVTHGGVKPALAALCPILCSILEHVAACGVFGGQKRVVRPHAPGCQQQYLQEQCSQ